MATENAWSRWASGAGAAGLVLVGVLADILSEPTTLILATAGAFVVSAFSVWRGGIARERESAAADWARSQRDFRSHMITLTAFIRSALQTKPQTVLKPGQDWSEVARECPWPLRDDYPVRSWAERNGGALSGDERQLLEVARYVENEDRNTIKFQVARSLLADVVTEWAQWRDRSTLARELRGSIREHRDALIMWAYLEIAHAEPLRMDSPAPAWRDLPMIYPELYEVPSKKGA